MDAINGDYYEINLSLHVIRIICGFDTFPRETTELQL